MQAYNYWKLDGNALDSKDNNNGTVSGAMVTTGKYGQAYYFDGEDAYIYGYDSGFTTWTGPRSVSFWAKPTEITGNMVFSYVNYSARNLYAGGINSQDSTWFIS